MAESKTAVTVPASSPTAAPATAQESSSSTDKSKPTKPDEELYKTELAAAEKELSDAVARLVRISFLYLVLFRIYILALPY